MRLPLLLSLALMCVSNARAAEEYRTWTNNEGNKIEAAMVSATGTDVVLKMKANGKEYKVSLTNISKADLEYVNKQRELQAQAGGKSNDSIGFENWNIEWPSLISGSVSPEIETVEENEEAKRFVYRSPRYEYVCDVKLSNNVVKRFAVLFESTHDFVAALPLSMNKTHQKDLHKIMLFETEQDYFRAGGPPGSAGVFMGGRNIIMVPLTSLGVEKGAGGYRVDYDKTNKTLPHEITHQLTDEAYYAPGSMGWFTEGLAEYVGVTPYRSGKFMVRGNQGAVVKYVTAYGEDKTGGRALGTEIGVPDLRAFMLQDYASFTRNANTNYGIGLMITYYFFHWDGKGDAARIKEFLKALKRGQRGDDALNVLLDGRSWDELEADIAKACRSRGVTLNFQ